MKRRTKERPREEMIFKPHPVTDSRTVSIQLPLCISGTHFGCHCRHFFFSFFVFTSLSPLFAVFFNCFTSKSKSWGTSRLSTGVICQLISRASHADNAADFRLYYIYIINNIGLDFLIWNFFINWKYFIINCNN